jgi:hypothetical protein
LIQIIATTFGSVIGGIEVSELSLDMLNENEELLPRQHRFMKHFNSNSTAAFISVPSEFTGFATSLTVPSSVD